MKNNIKNLLTVACVAIDPIAVRDFHRWNKKRNRKQQETQKQENEVKSPWPPPTVEIKS